MKGSLILFTIGILFIVAHYSFKTKPVCPEVEEKIKYIPMSVYEEIENSNPLI